MPMRGPRTLPERVLGADEETVGAEGVGSGVSVRQTKERMETQKDIIDHASQTAGVASSTQTFHHIDVVVPFDS